MCGVVGTHFLTLWARKQNPKPSCKSPKEQGKIVKNRPSDQKGGLAAAYAKIRKLTEASSILTAKPIRKEEKPTHERPKTH